MDDRALLVVERNTSDKGSLGLELFESPWMTMKSSLMERLDWRTRRGASALWASEGGSGTGGKGLACVSSSGGSSYGGGSSTGSCCSLGWGLSMVMAGFDGLSSFVAVCSLRFDGRWGTEVGRPVRRSSTQPHDVAPNVVPTKSWGFFSGNPTSARDLGISSIYSLMVLEYLKCSKYGALPSEGEVYDR